MKLEFIYLCTVAGYADKQSIVRGLCGLLMRIGTFNIKYQSIVLIANDLKRQKEKLNLISEIVENANLSWWWKILMNDSDSISEIRIVARFLKMRKTFRA